ncbi:histidine phosphatase family protein LALA0_S01e00166g [Lachancea lanzarotensis]|uniref:acid phosphatase n=1 Tax=Lachancea lanzarotensis TaxID=1245769 RepID=A0A0C7MX09_9SACH|nr:uncharacterized protein LALA0_S01e00166g [Lachancea lanzarotensis]CEP59974.1 LALA0S01e00166g1_1 [Lachancea lanzarotensis]
MIYFALLCAFCNCVAYAIPVSKNEKFTDITIIGTQNDLFPFFGGSAPYFSYPMNSGVSVEAPDKCSMKQIQLFARHGERYPTNSTAQLIKSTYGKLKNAHLNSTGSLSFINDDYCFFLEDPTQFEELTTLKNVIDPIDPYSGQQDAQRHAREFMYHYGDLLENTTTLPIFTSNSKRVHDTALYFGQALSNKLNISMQVISEEASSGANTLTPYNSCKDYNETEHAAIYAKFPKDYLSGISRRLLLENPGLNLTTSDVTNMFSWCAYEIDTRGYSPMCEIFTREELVYYSYNLDLISYYGEGAGNSLSADVGSVPFNSSIELLKQSEYLDNKVWLSFTHDTNLINYLTAIGLFDDGLKLPADHIPFRQSSYHRSWMVPLGARIYTQLYQCGNESYVRYVVNDAVIPLEQCSTGPGLSCKLSDFLDYAEKQLQKTNFLQDCKVEQSSNQTELTFYWDYQKMHYNAPLFLSEPH